jgi:hypothetical protein
VIGRTHRDIYNPRLPRFDSGVNDEEFSEEPRGGLLHWSKSGESEARLRGVNLGTVDHDVFRCFDAQADLVNEFSEKSRRGLFH